MILDTHLAIWALTDPRRLDPVLAAETETAERVWFGAVSCRLDGSAFIAAAPSWPCYVKLSSLH